MSNAERLARERAFHNEKRFGEEDTRKHLDRWYVAVEHAVQAQREQVRRLAAGGTVLEYGCADGEVALDLYAVHETAREIHGIDISDVAVDKAAARAARIGARNAAFHAGNAEALPFEDGKFDLVYGKGIIHHLDLERSFAELKRVLKPGGTISFCEPLGHNPLLNWYRNRTPELRTPDEHPLLAKDFELCRRHFRDVRTRFFGLATLAAVPLGGRFLRELRALDRALLALPLLQRQAWFVLLSATS